MYQVLLADDEPSVTDALSRSIDWAGMGLEVAAVVRNGAEAIQCLQTMPIDIVITDIRMANIDGLSLCQKIAAMGRNVQTIIISGFAEFSYAQKAINYGAIGYCLKPLEYDEIKRYLRRAVQRLSQNDEQPDYDGLLEGLQDGEEEELTAAFSSFGLNADAYYAAVSVGREPYPVQSKQDIVLRLGYHQFAYFSLLPFSEARLNAFAQGEQVDGFSRTLDAQPVSALAQAIKSMNNSAFQFFFEPEKKIFPEKLEDGGAAILKQITKAAALGDADQTLAYLERLRGADGKGFTLRSAWRLYGIISSCQSFSAADEDISSPAQLVFKFHDFSAMLTALQKCILEGPAEQREDALSNSSFIQMMSYINSHYEQGLTLNQLAKEMNLNANYLSQVFKKETGKTFMKYITELRIDKAKEMLDSGEYSVSQIASNLGFNDYFYFLKTFKRVVGLTTKQYKQGGQATDEE